MTAAESKLLEKLRTQSREVIYRLRIAIDLAEVSLDGPAPENGAEHLVCAVDELRPELTAMRRGLRAAEAIP